MFYMKQESLNLQLSLFRLGKVLIVRTVKQRSKMPKDGVGSLALGDLQELD